MSGRIALATCAEIPAGDEDFRALIAALAEVGVEAKPAVWDADADWCRFDLVVLRSTWDYAERRDAFLAWARSAPRRPAHATARSPSRRSTSTRNGEHRVERLRGRGSLNPT
jgi:hypothetical protein